jgi:stress response protein SCP2
MGVNLTKGQKISLEKEAGGTLTKIIMGLGWDAVKTKRGFSVVEVNRKRSILTLRA